MNALDKSSLEERLKLLRLALKFGFESDLSSPMELMLDTTTDLLLLIATSFEEGKLDQRKNKVFVPNKRDVSDALGNRRIISKTPQRNLYFDPEAAKFLKKLAGVLIGLKNRLPLDKALIAYHVDLTFLHSAKLRQKLEKDKASKQKKLYKSKVSSEYHRRQRQRKRS